MNATDSNAYGANVGWINRQAAVTIPLSEPRGGQPEQRESKNRLVIRYVDSSWSTRGNRPRVNASDSGWRRPSLVPLIYS